MRPTRCTSAAIRFPRGHRGRLPQPVLPLDALRRINRVRRLSRPTAAWSSATRYREQCREHLDILGLLEEGRNTEAAEALRRGTLVTTIRNLDRIRPLLEH